MIARAVVPVAGLGTRLLPVTRAVPKEMLAIVDRPVVQYVIEELARDGMRSVLLVTGTGQAGDRRPPRCVDRSFDARRRMLELDARHVEMVQCARASGASANYTGSGGAIIAICPDAAIRSHARRALKALGCQVY